MGLDSVRSRKEPAGRTRQYFFCIGPMKSGTTVLARVLDQHPKIGCLVEAKVLNRLSSSSILNLTSAKYKKHGFSESLIRSIRFDPLLTVVLQLRRVTGFSWTGIYRYARIRFFRKAMTALLDDFARRCSVPVVGDKTPNYIDGIDVISKAFPDAKIIYCIRDPRAIWNSTSNAGGIDPYEHIRTVLDADEKTDRFLFDRAVYRIRYEDLISRPMEAVPALYKYLGCDFEAQYLEYALNRDPYPDRWYWIPKARESLDPATVEKWKQTMPEKDIAEVTRLSRTFLDKYGYV